MPQSSRWRTDYPTFARTAGRAPRSPWMSLVRRWCAGGEEVAEVRRGFLRLAPIPGVARDRAQGVIQPAGDAFGPNGVRLPRGGGHPLTEVGRPTDRAPTVHLSSDHGVARCRERSRHVWSHVARPELLSVRGDVGEFSKRRWQGRVLGSYRRMDEVNALGWQFSWSACLAR